jgi:hypothetical protein
MIIAQEKLRINIRPLDILRRYICPSPQRKSDNIAATTGLYELVRFLSFMGYSLRRSWMYYCIPLEMRNTPTAMVRHPTTVTGFTDSSNISHEKKTTATYPKLTMGYAMLSLTRESTTSHDRALIPKMARPDRTIGFSSALRIMDGALARLDTLPTFTIPSFNNNCPRAASDTLKIIRSMSFNILPLPSR